MEAMKVELACLADSKTFNLAIQIVTTPNGVEVRGQVPDESTRQHVLRLARQASYAPVQDRLTIVEPCADPALRDTAQTTVSRALAQRDAQVRVQVPQKGVVSLVGHVANMEDKLQASRSLRATKGCTRVENNLEVRNASEGGMAMPSLPDKVTIVQADQRVTPPATVPASPAAVCEAEKLMLPAPRAQVLPTPPAPHYVRIRVRQEAQEPVRTTPPAVTPYGYTQAATLKPSGLPGFPGATAPASTVHLPPTQFAPPPTILGHLRTMIRGQHTERTAPIISEVRVSPTPTTVAGYTPATATVPLPNSAAVPNSTPPVGTTAKGMTPVAASPRGLTVPAAAPQTWPAAHATAQASETPAGLPAPVAPVAPAPQIVPAAAPSVQVAPMPVSTSRVLTAEQMRGIIATGCGRLCREVKVTARADGQPVFHVYAASKVEQELTGKLLTIPEVVASNAHIQIHLEP
jgi:osmotically-inducible protein OsmY